MFRLGPFKVVLHVLGLCWFINTQGLTTIVKWDKPHTACAMWTLLVVDVGGAKQRFVTEFRDSLLSTHLFDFANGH